MNFLESYCTVPIRNNVSAKNVEISFKYDYRLQALFSFGASFRYVQHAPSALSTRNL
jgi:hypothetical protein